jgi:hypothetical protein
MSSGTRSGTDRINQGLMPEWAQDPASDFHFVECADAEDGTAKMLQIACRPVMAWTRPATSRCSAR